MKTFVPQPHTGREFPSELADLVQQAEMIHEGYFPPPLHRDGEGEANQTEGVPPPTDGNVPAAVSPPVLDETPEEGFPDRFFNPIIGRILLGYASDPIFQNKVFTKTLKRTKTGLFLQPHTQEHAPPPPGGTDPISGHDLLTVPAATTLAGGRGRAPSAAPRCAIMVPNDRALKRDIIVACHMPAYSGHRGAELTLELIRRDFEWPGLSTDVKLFVAHCHACQVNKCRHTKALGLMKPLSIPYRRFGSWSMDMIVALPRTKRGFDAILVVVCRLSKYTWFIPCHTSATAADCAKLVFDNVCKYVGLPDEIVSDRDKRFGGGKFSAELWRLYGVAHHPSTAYHPQSDGQTERMNKVLHEYIRNYIGPSHKDWDSKLTMAQFALNNSYSASIGASPFYFVLGFHPKTPLTHLLDEEEGPVPDATTFALARNSQLLLAQSMLTKAQARMKLHYDKSRVAAQFKVGDSVLLSTRNLNLDGCAKYLPRYVGPFTVTELIGTDSKHGTLAYRLDLPPTWKIHDVFHISILKAYLSDGEAPERPPLPLPVLLDDYSYKIEHIMEHKLIPFSTSTYRYRVHLWDTTPENDVWEDEPTLLACVPSLLESYKAAHGL
jgi:hypothetical protein